MWKSIQMRLFPLIITLSALSVSLSAAFYSISGLSKLFAGAAFAVIVMAASLEIAKLVIASLLYQYRKTLPKLLKYYLSIACIVLIIITSMGIYGFLSAAYQETAVKEENINSKITLVEVKRDNIKEQLIVYNEEKSTINNAVAELRSGLSNNVIRYTDTSGNVVTTTSSATRRALEKQLDQAIDRQTTINNKVDILNDKIFQYETEIVEIKTSDEVTSELGPLKYLSGLTGWAMDRIINWLLLVIIFVFDPLAIALVIAANFAFEQLKNPTFIPKSIKIRQPKKVKMSVPEGMKFNTPYPLNPKPEVKIVEKEVPVEVEKIVEKEIIKEVPVEVEKIVEKEVIKEVPIEVEKFDDLDLNKDGVIDDEELVIGIKNLNEKIKHTKKTGDDSKVEIYTRQLNSLISKLSKDQNPNKKNYW